MVPQSKMKKTERGAEFSTGGGHGGDKMWIQLGEERRDCFPVLVLGIGNLCQIKACLMPVPPETVILGHLENIQEVGMCWVLLTTFRKALQKKRQA